MAGPHTIPGDARFALASGVRVQVDRITGETLVLSPEGLRELNATAAAIVARCDGEATVQAMAETLAREYETPVGELLPDLLECLQQLEGRKLITRVP